MPFVRIDVLEGRSDEQLAAIGDAIQRAMVECFDVPERDQFQIITEHRRGRLIYNPAYLDVARTDGVLIGRLGTGSRRMSRSPRPSGSDDTFSADASAAKEWAGDTQLFCNIVDLGTPTWGRSTPPS